MKVPRKELPKEMKPAVGLQIFAESPDGHTVPLWITEVSATDVTLDGNHPLSGMKLFFSVEVKRRFAPLQYMAVPISPVEGPMFPGKSFLCSKFTLIG